jgi:hypothetical protein
MVGMPGSANVSSGIVIPDAPVIVNPYAGWSQNDVKDRIRQLLGDVEVPRFRKAVFETLRRLRDPDTTPGKIMEVMSVDAQLVGKVMNTVNSTAYSPKSKVQSLDHAIMLMGNADLERIVMIVGSKAALPSQGQFSPCGSGSGTRRHGPTLQGQPVLHRRVPAGPERAVDRQQQKGRLHENLFDRRRREAGSSRAGA